jgi:cytochrome c oxidase cbb3-type subunit 4
VSQETLGVLRGIATVLAMIGFIGACVWAYSRKRAQQFDAAARLPLEEDAHE